MDSSVTHPKPDFDTKSDNRDSRNTQKESNDYNHEHEKALDHAGRDVTQMKSDKQQPGERADSVATVVETNPFADHSKDMDKIKTDRTNDQHTSPDQSLDLTETIKHATHNAKRKLYLHHRTQRGLSKQFTEGSALKHLPFIKHNGSNNAKAHEDPEAQTKSAETQSPTVWQNFWIMLTTFPYWNMAFWSGWCYSIGSALFVIDGAWSWVPQAWPETEFEGQAEYGVPLLFFFGACLYQVGGVMAYLEAVNDGSFAGAAMKRLLEGHQDIEKEFLDAKLHTFFGHLVPHHHDDDDDGEHQTESSHQHESSDPASGWKSLDKSDTQPEEVYAEAKDRVERRGGVDHGPTEKGEVREYMTWRWWPTWHGLTTYHIFEMGYVACAIQLFGVTLYGVTSVVILPGILDSLEWWQELAAYWIPQVVASCCFLIASIMFTIMAQDKWYKPKLNTVSWWIGFWAQAGSVGFLLCAVFGLYSDEHTWGEYQSSLSSTWGSFFYMTSGLFQWYEAINVNVGPVLAFPNNRTPVLLRRSPS